MLELFRNMMKEEWRVHSTMFGSLSFALFPVMIFFSAFMGTFLLPMLGTTLPPGNLMLIIHANFLLLGFMVGAFGLLGSEVMERRLGQASLLSYSSRSLPLTERFIFANFVVKDTVYYFILWVFPFSFGFMLASPFIGVPFTLSLLLMLTLTLSFLIGLSVIFFLSTVYARSKATLALVLIILATGWAAFSLVSGINPALLFPPLMLFHAFTWVSLIVSCTLVILLFGISIALFNQENTGTTKRYRNVLSPLMRRLSFFPYPPLAAKDLIDLYRSGSAVGQTLFSFLVPLVVMWFFLALLGGFLPPHGLLFLFALLTGVIASTMYTWITAFDTFSSYACLPVGISTLISSKITSFTVLQVIPAIFIMSVAVVSGEVLYLVPALVLCLSVSYYALGVTVWLTGLSPNVLVYDVKVMCTYLILIGIALAVFSTLSFASPFYALSSVLLLIPGWILVKAGCARWETRDQIGF